MFLDLVAEFRGFELLQQPPVLAAPVVGIDGHQGRVLDEEKELPFQCWIAGFDKLHHPGPRFTSLSRAFLHSTSLILYGSSCLQITQIHRSSLDLLDGICCFLLAGRPEAAWLAENFS
jgi:hypothetical protein